MKNLIVIILLVLLQHLPANAAENNFSGTTLPEEYSGYMIYDAIDKKGDTVTVKQPVRYKAHPTNYPSDNDENYQYRNYRIELQRVKTATEEADKNETENKKINSAAYYPLYLD